jgi:manganese/zinc/iron transport system permease protein
MGIIVALILALGVAFFKVLMLATFDPELAASLGFAPALLHYGLMSMVSVTAVGAFDAVGSILVVALMIGPPAAAYLLTDDLKRMIGLSVLIGVISSILGYWLAHWLDASIAGAIATMIGIVFLAVMLFAPARGLVAQVRRRRRQRVDFAQTMLAIHVMNHEGTAEALTENRVDGLEEHLHWDPRFTARIVDLARRQNLVTEHAGVLTVTDAGRLRAQSALTR